MVKNKNLGVEVFWDFYFSYFVGLEFVCEVVLGYLVQGWEYDEVGEDDVVE